MKYQSKVYLLYSNNVCIESLSEARDKAEEARDRSDFSADDDNLLLKATADVPNSPDQLDSSIPIYSGKCMHLFLYIYIIYTNGAMFNLYIM